MESLAVRQESATLALRAVATDHPVAAYLARLSPGASWDTMGRALIAVAGILSGGVDDKGQPKGNPFAIPWGSITRSQTMSVRAYLDARDDDGGRRYAPSTANKHLSALRGVLKEAWRLGQLDGEQMARATDLPPIRGTRVLSGRSLTPVELRRLYAACERDESPAGLRDAALFVVGFTAGLRRAEISGLDLSDYDTESGELLVRDGKGGKQRRSYIAQGRLVLDAWLQLRGDSPGPLLYGMGRHPKLPLRARRLSTQAILGACYSRAEQAGVRRFSPHDMRRTFVSTLLEQGCDLVTAQKLAGHASPTTTARYDRRDERQMREAVASLAVPYSL